MFSPSEVEHLTQGMLSGRNEPHPSVCPSPQGEDSVQMLVEPENDSLPLMEISTCKVSLCLDRLLLGWSLALSHTLHRPSSPGLDPHLLPADRGL